MTRWSLPTNSFLVLSHKCTKALSLLKKGDNDIVQVYQSIVGAMQWAISIGHFNISTAIMTMSGFRAQPHCQHCDHVKHIYGYMFKMKDAKIVIQTEEPEYSEIPVDEYDWSHSVYGDVKELTTKDTPEPLGKFVTLLHYINANLFHDMITGHSIMGILHFLNKMPINWYAKKQATVETATYWSEYVKHFLFNCRVGMLDVIILS